MFRSLSQYKEWQKQALPDIFRSDVSISINVKYLYVTNAQQIQSQTWSKDEKLLESLQVPNSKVKVQSKQSTNRTGL